MTHDSNRPKLSRREMLGAVGLAPLMQSAIVSCANAADTPPLNGVAGIDRVTVLQGRTYLRGWAGYGDPPIRTRRTRRRARPPVESGPAPGAWSRESGQER